MTRRGRILGVIVAGLALAVLGLAVVLGYDSACAAPEPLPAGETAMQAIVYRCYGPPEVLAMEDVAKPAPARNEVLVKVEAAAINPLDGHFMRGQPYFMRLFSGIGKPIAKAYGAEVTGVSSTRNVELVRSIGADDVIDYKQADFTQGTVRYDVIIDNVGNHALLALRRVLEPEGVVVMVGGSSDDHWVGPLMGPIGAAMLSPFVSQRFAGLLAELNPEDLRELGELLAPGKMKSVIDQRYPLREVPAAIAYLEEGRARGKVVIDLE